MGFDKIGKATGPGRFEAELSAGPPIICQFLLFNYNIDGNTLKPEHKRDLDKHVVPVLKEHRVHAKLTGMASRTGASEYNRNLSLGRVLRVKDYLKKQGIPESQLPGPDIVAAGEDLSTSQSDEDERDRAVRIAIAFGIKPLPLFPTIIIPIVITPDGPDPVELPPAATPRDPEERWTIRQIYGHNANVGFGASVPGIGVGAAGGLVEYHFLLVNRKTGQMAQCRYFGPGGSVSVGPADGQRLPGSKPVSVGPTAGISFTMQSKTWDNFETRQGTDFSNFEGRAIWIEPGSVGLTTDISAKATLRLPDQGISVKVTTGRTIGFPGSTASAGDFTCKAPVQLQLP